MIKIDFKIVVLFFILFPFYAHAQDYNASKDYKKDTIITGKVYKVIISSGWETEGRIISQDSAAIIIRSKLQKYTIFKDQIVAIGKPSDELIKTRGSNSSSYDFRIYLTKNRVIDGVKLTGINNDTLFCKTSAGKHKIPVDNISKLKYIDKPQLWIGAAVGAVLGGLIGYLVGPDSSPQSGQYHFVDFWWEMDWRPITCALGTVTGALIGAGISALTGMDIDYNLSQMDRQSKNGEIKKIIEENE